MKHLLTIGLLLVTAPAYSSDEIIELTKKEFESLRKVAILRNVTLHNVTLKGSFFEELCCCAHETPTAVLKIIHDDVLQSNRYIHKTDLKKILTPRPPQSCISEHVNENPNFRTFTIWISDQCNTELFQLNLTFEKNSAKQAAVFEVLNLSKS